MPPKKKKWFDDYLIQTITMVGNEEVITVTCNFDKVKKDDAPGAVATARCTCKWINTSGNANNRIVEHAKKYHGYDEDKHNARMAALRGAATANNSDGAQLGAALTQLTLHQCANQPATVLDNRQANNDFSAVASVQDNELRFLSSESFSIVESPAYRNLFREPAADSQAMATSQIKSRPIIKERRLVPGLMLELAARVRHHQLARHQGQAAAIACDGGTKFHRFVLFVVCFFQSAPILLSMVPVASLEGKSLDGGEVNRLINYYKTILLQKYKIITISFIADNASYMHSNAAPALSEFIKDEATRIQLEQDDVINAKTGDPFLPSRLDGTSDFDIGGIDKRRCTLHSLQLFIMDLCDKLAILKTALAYADTVYAAIEKFMSENKNWRDLFPSLFLPSKGCATRWWSKTLNYFKECMNAALAMNFDMSDVSQNLASAVAFLEQYKEISDKMEGFTSGVFDCLFVFHMIDRQADVVVNNNSVTSTIINQIWNEDVHTTGGRIQKLARHKFWKSDINILVSFFHPGFLFHKSPEMLTVGADWVTEKLERMFGYEVGDEHERFRNTIARVADVYKNGPEKEFTEEEYMRFWNNAFRPTFPLLTAAVLGMLQSCHTEVECERALSTCAHVFPPSRSNMAAVSCHAAIVVYKNWSIEFLDKITKAKMDKIHFNGNAAKRFVERFLLPMIQERIEAEKKDNKNFAACGTTELNTISGRRRANRNDESETASETTKMKKRKEAENKFLLEECKKQFEEGVKALTAADLVCCACDKTFQQHEDVFGNAACWDWFIECSCCGKLCHSDCCGLPPVQRSRAEQSTSWICATCEKSTENVIVLSRVQLQLKRIEARQRRNAVVVEED